LKHFLIYKHMVSHIFVCFVLFGVCASVSFAQEKKVLSILPFETIASEDISYIQAGVLRMLHSRMSWKNKVDVLSKKSTLDHLNRITTKNKNKQIAELAQLSKSDYVMTGTITQFSNAFSIDTRIYDIHNKQYLTFSEQSKILSDLIAKVDFIAAKINKKVFERTTISFDRIVNQEKEKYEQLKRQNPEKLMPEVPKTNPGEKTSKWKFWEYM